MKTDIGAKDYFLARQPESEPERIMYARIINAIDRHLNLHTVVTMNELCEMTEKELGAIRNIGAKSRAIILEECAKYKQKT